MDDDVDVARFRIDRLRAGLVKQRESETFEGNSLRVRNLDSMGGFLQDLCVEIRGLPAMAGVEWRMRVLLAKSDDEKAATLRAIDAIVEDDASTLQD
jgi:hypothetical protein